MKTLNTFFSLALSGALAAAVPGAQAQQSFYERFESHNSIMAGLQPSWVAPLVESDPRLGQSARFAFSNEYAPGARTVSYGNGRGVTLVAPTRLEFDFNPPSYFQNHSATLKDGAGDAAMQVKYRIASGDARHGNFIVTAMLYRSFATGTYANGAPTGVFVPKLAAGVLFRRFDVQTTLGGAMPTGKIAAQGRAIEWNVAAQAHATAHVWFEVENNATFNYGGPYDAKTQNFITPAAFYMVRRKDWAPTHPFFIVDGGMQIATTTFHLYNHNLISEVRILF